jgi:hypothetical protein
VEIIIKPTAFTQYSILPAYLLFNQVTFTTRLNMSQSNQTIAFFGASGGCSGSALGHALIDGVHCTARTPSQSP